MKFKNSIRMLILIISFIKMDYLFAQDHTQNNLDHELLCFLNKDCTATSYSLEQVQNLTIQYVNSLPSNFQDIHSQLDLLSIEILKLKKSNKLNLINLNMFQRQFQRKFLRSHALIMSNQRTIANTVEIGTEVGLTIGIFLGFSTRLNSYSKNPFRRAFRTAKTSTVFTISGGSFGLIEGSALGYDLQNQIEKEVKELER